jgi:hypothetical protein
MIVEQQKQAEVLSEGISQETIEMSLDSDSAQFLMQMLSKNLYSDPIGSTVRETCSNALDSHRRAGVTDPIIVKFGTNSDYSYEFSVEDFGIGLDDDDVKQIISKYGKSTKRGIANEFGMFGIGFKSPLAYTSSFTFITRKDGIERSYMMYEGENINTIDLLYQCPTPERNGTKVKVPVNFSDRWEFVNKIREQLAYFRNVYFDVNLAGNQIEDFNIYESGDFIVSTLSRDSDLHICLDNVYYPVDFTKLGIARIDSNIALKFSLTDGIIPTPNRESIRYTPESKVIILRKIQKIADFLIEKYNNDVKEYSDPLELFKFYNESDIYLVTYPIQIKLNGFVTHSNVNLKIPSMKGVSLINIREIYDRYDKAIWLCEYSVKYEMSGGRIRESKRSTINHYELDKAILVLDKNFPKLGRDYIRDVYRNKQTLIIEKSSPTPLKRKYYYGLSTDYMTLLNLNKHPKSEWRQRIQEFQLVRDAMLNNFTMIDEGFVPQTWIDNRKAKYSYRKSTNRKYVTSGGNKKVRLKGDAICKQAEKLLRYVNGQYCKFEPTTIDLEKIDVTNRVFIYDKHENSRKLDKLYSAIFKKENVKLVTFSDRELKLISKTDSHNLISYKEFMEGKHIIFRRIVTSHLIKVLSDTYSNCFNKYYVLNKISSDLHDKIVLLSNYQSKHYSYGDRGLYNEMITIAEENNWFDDETYTIYKEVKQTLEKFKFINDLFKYVNSSDSNNEGLMSAIIKLCKYENLRINIEHYNVSINN